MKLDEERIISRHIIITSQRILFSLFFSFFNGLIQISDDISVCIFLLFSFSSSKFSFSLSRLISPPPTPTRIKNKERELSENAYKHILLVFFSFFFIIIFCILSTAGSLAQKRKNTNEQK